MNLLSEINSQLTALVKCLKYKKEPFIPALVTIYLGRMEKEYIDNSHCSVNFTKDCRIKNIDTFLNQHQGLLLFKDTVPHFRWVFTDYEKLFYIEYNDS